MNYLLIAAILSTLAMVGVTIRLHYHVRRDDETWWAAHEREMREDGHTVVRPPDWRTWVARQRAGLRVMVVVMILATIVHAGVMLWTVYWYGGIVS